ncbi:MAG: GNAT family N-acetyltransferase [Spirochaetaceae bacterium]|nr:MAG: GNAT family N-acetyltransferase [Spirochaetaceae bacterium]
MSDWKAVWIERIRDVDRDEWTRLTDRYETPLLDWEWLRILEESGSVTPSEGWLPQHLLLYRDGELIAAAPLYVKTHSVGEFVFDYAWAEVAESLGTRYYPKLVAMSPLTPAIGYRFLVDERYDDVETVAVMLDAIDGFCRANRLHGFSILWPEPDFIATVNAAADSTESGGFTPWEHQHFRWENASFAAFDDYLAVFNKNQRRNIKRERASMDDQGIRIDTRTAADSPDRFCDIMYRYYSNTNDQFGMWAARFLTADFFGMLKETCGQRVVFCAAFEGGATDPVGMSMLLHKHERLIGRYWGAERFVNNLHFNLCYYEPIRWGIEHGVKRFDPGMGSSHKVRRGFAAVSTSSLHRFADRRMQMVMDMNIDKINRYEQAHIESLNSHLPFADR